MRLVQDETTKSELLEGSEFGVFWGQTLFEQLPQKRALIEHVLYEKDVIFITARSGVGKSILALQMMGSLTSGKPFLNSFRVLKPCNVLYLQTEGDRTETIERIRNMEMGVEFDHSKWAHINLDGICLNTDVGFAQFSTLLNQPNLEYDVIIIDPLYTTVKGSLSNDEVATEWVRYIRAIKRRFNCAFIIIHHESIKDTYVEGQKVVRGDKDLMGSTYWGAFASYNYKLSGSKDKGYILKRGKERNANTIDSLELRLIEPTPLMFIITEDNLNVSEIQVLQLLSKVGGALLAREIINQTNLSKATVYRILSKMLEQCKIEKVTDGVSTKYKLKE